MPAPMTPQQRHAYERQRQWEAMTPHQQNRIQHGWRVDTAKLAVTVFAVVFSAMVVFSILAKMSH